jgi:hypothetical protein
MSLSFSRCLAISSFLAGLACLFSTPSASAQTTILVNDIAQGPTALNPDGRGDTTCTLGDAILTANSLALNGQPVGGCLSTGTGAPYTIQLSHTTYVLTIVHNYWYGPNALPPIATTIVIEGNGATLQVPENDANGNPIKRLRFFYVGADPSAPPTLGFVTPGAGNLTLKDVTLMGGRQLGGTGGAAGAGGAGMGGAIFSQGSLQLVNTTMTANSATGGGTDSSFNRFFFGAGGMGQDGQSNQGTPVGGGFGGLLTSAVGGSFTAFSKGGTYITGLNSGGAGFGLTDNGAATGGGIPDGLGGQSSETKSAGHGSGGGSVFCNSDASSGGDFGVGGQECAGGGVGGGAGTFTDPLMFHYKSGGGGFGGGGGAGGGGGFGGGALLSPEDLGGNSGAAGYGGSLSGGSAGMGGAIFNHGGSLNALNSTLSANSATGGPGGGAGLGGAIFNLNGAVTLSFSTLDKNSVAVGSGGGNLASGGAIYSVGYNLVAGQAAKLVIRNSILGDTVGGSDLASDQPSNVAPGGGGGPNAATASVTFQGANIVMSAAYTGAGTVQGPPPLTASPLIGPLQLNPPGLTPTMAIPYTSPAFKVTTCDQTVATDQRGVSRPQPGLTACDIGAFEVQTQTITFNPIPQQVVGAVVTLNATASSNLPVTFTSLTTTCSVSGSAATMLALGTCTIQASQSGGMGYAPAPSVTQSINVVPPSNFSIKPLPPKETIDRRDPAGFVLELDSLNGFNSNVRLTCSGGPAGSVCIVFPQTVKVNGRAFAIAGIAFPRGAAARSYTITFTGVSGALTHSATATVTLK